MSVKHVGVVTPDMARVRQVVKALEESSEFNVSVVLSSAWQEANIFDFGQLYSRSDVLYFDGISPSLAFFARIKSDKKLVIRLFGPELVVDSTRQLPWKNIKKAIIVNSYYYKAFCKTFETSMQIPVNLVKLDRPDTFMPTTKVKLDWSSKKFSIFHPIGPEFDVFSVTNILKNNPDFSCSIVGRKVSVAILDLLMKELDRYDIPRNRIEIYENLSPDIMADFVEEHPHVVSMRPDEAVFHNIREMLALGCNTYVRRTACSEGVFPKKILVDLPTFKFEKKARKFDIPAFCDAGEIELMMSTFKEI